MQTSASPMMEQFWGIVRHSAEMMSLCAKTTAANVKQLTRSYESLNDLYHEQTALLNKPPAELAADAIEYAIDYTQRSIIFWDVLRIRGNQYLEHVAAGQPPVLIFKYKILLDGRTFEHPVNYALVEIEPPKGVKIDKSKRPYVIVDPRAGHGSGIGGFKDDSQVGVVVRAGHPVYFVIFFPEPEPGQTLRDITVAEEKFLQEVADLHPKSPKPCIIGNCQGGWAVMALTAANPDIAGSVVINGAPLAYWAGENGKNPMRYSGGILGGSWPVQFAGDLGNGKFDGANLVMNFEQLNPANTYWQKHYNLFSKIDTEEKNFLDFERWWGGFSLMTTREMRGIVDNLFIGNKLSHGKIPLDSFSNIDLRKIKLPIIIFCSEGDNITPPQQALNWIADIYPNILELKLAGQTIVYMVHQSVGHLGIFVSSKVAKKEHQQIIDLLNYVESLPPGLFEMVIHEEANSTETTPSYSVKLQERSIEDLLARNGEDQTSKDHPLFNTSRAISDFNTAAYDLFLSPTVRAFSNDYVAEQLREMHPMRLSRYLISDRNPAILPLNILAPVVRKHRKIAKSDNIFMNLQQTFSKAVSSSLYSYRELRDSSTEILFYSIYGSLHAVLPTDLPFRDGFINKISKATNNNSATAIIAKIEEGGVPAAVLRILLLLIKAQGFTTGSHIGPGLQKLRESEAFAKLRKSQIRTLTNTQTVIVEYDQSLAVTTLPQLLKTRKAKKLALETVKTVLAAIKVELGKKPLQLFKKIERLLQD